MTAADRAGSGIPGGEWPASPVPVSARCASAVTFAANAKYERSGGGLLARLALRVVAGGELPGDPVGAEGFDAGADAEADQRAMDKAGVPTAIATIASMTLCVMVVAANRCIRPVG